MRKSESVNTSFVSAEKEVPFWMTDIGENEIATVSETMAAKLFSMGAVTAKMEAEISKQLDVPYVLCTTSGSMALMMGLMAAGVSPGDEVIVPTRTFIATAHAASLLGAGVVLVDSRSDSPNMDVAETAKKITPRTKAIMPVHLNGRVCDMAAVRALAEEHGLAVIEDACQGMFSRGPGGFQGTLGDCGCFSFGMVKLVSTGQGGAIVTSDRGLYKKLAAIRNHGVADVVSHTYLTTGHNFKFNDIQASIGLWQVRRGPEKASHVNAIYKRYRERLEGLSFIELVPVDVDNGEVALWTEVVSEERDDLMAFLAEEGIQTRKFIPCVHTAPHFGGSEEFPNSERFNRTGFNLPCGPDLPLDYVDRTIEALKRYAKA
ncbi:MAG: DegT/DnrJ/EryC1/StrS family aminotransferase [Alphaproteobacteria bacterium]|jgi:dTDP-4-amino-4,6-dideoxygalactose transaminase|nr:DegT/DnrJ/EryC1/StrS family aminotransferase [Alphaproteobacteria bacterium]MDP7190437.1 DegT/DnrJ/EryC1/StrS family aminotransferase [Alphaproteobacteria bacterium]HJO88038.1 DegT/DnrJ/EryC1/StrS family aminotransferase [Alphaproteobacteria bacterium]